MPSPITLKAGPLAPAEVQRAVEILNALANLEVTVSLPSGEQLKGIVRVEGGKALLVVN